MARPLFVLALLLGAAALPAGIHAQVEMELPIGREAPSVHLQVHKPFPANAGPYRNSNLFTSVWNASVVLPLNPVTTFATWGFSYAGVEGAPSSLTTSNLRLGALFGGSSWLRGDAYVELPLYKGVTDEEYARGLALYSDYMRFDRFLSDAWSIGASATGSGLTDSGGTLGGRLGGALLVPTDGTDSELFARFGVFARMPAGEWTLGLDVSGLADVSTEGATFAERTAFFGTVSITWPQNRMSPEIFVQGPIDELTQDFVNFVVGLRLRVMG